MKKNAYLVNLMHVAAVFLYCAVCLLIRAFAPAVILPRWDFSVLMILSLLPLVITRYLDADASGNWIAMILLGGVTFTVLPLCAGLTFDTPAWKLLLLGTAVFGVTKFLYSCTEKCTAKGCLRHISPVVNALLLFLAGQCIEGMF